MAFPEDQQPNKMSGYNWKKIVTTVVGYLAFGMAMVIAAGNVFALAVKAKFHLTQTECEYSYLFSKISIWVLS